MKGKVKTFRILLPFKKGDDKSVYAFQSHWDSESIKKAVLLSERKGKLPNFSLLRVEIHPGGSCSLNCGFCYGKKMAPKKRENLAASAIEKALGEISEKMPLENPLVVLSGFYSEPFTNPEIKRIIKAVGDNGFRIGIYTNGLLFDKEAAKIIVNAAEKAKNPLPSYVSFNITASIQARYFAKLLKTIKLLAKARKNPQNLLINAPISIDRLSRKEISIWKKRIRLLKTAGADYARLSVPWEKISPVKSKKKPAKIDFEILEEIAGKFKNVHVRKGEPTSPHNKCYAMAMAMNISPEGLVFPCPEMSTTLRKEFSYGSILKESITEIWHGKKHEKLFQKTIPKLKNCQCFPTNDQFNSLCESFRK